MEGNSILKYQATLQLLITIFQKVRNQRAFTAKLNQFLIKIKVIPKTKRSLKTVIDTKHKITIDKIIKTTITKSICKS